MVAFLSLPVAWNLDIGLETLLDDASLIDSTPEHVTLHRGMRRNPVLLLSKIPRQSCRKMLYWGKGCLALTASAECEILHFLLPD